MTDTKVMPTQDVKANANVVYSIGIANDTNQELQYALAVEKDEEQASIKSEAKHTNKTEIEVYVSRLAAKTFKDKIELLQAKREKVLLKTVQILIARGHTEESARIALGLGDNRQR